MTTTPSDIPQNPLMLRVPLAMILANRKLERMSYGLARNPRHREPGPAQRTPDPLTDYLSPKRTLGVEAEPVFAELVAEIGDPTAEVEAQS